MNRPDDFEKQLREFAGTEASERMMERAEQAEELSEDEIIAYYSGEMSEQERQRIGPLIAFSEAASAYLDALEADVDEVTASMREAAPEQQSVLSRAWESLRSLWEVHPRALALAGAGAALVLMVAILPFGPGRGPGELAPYRPDATLLEGRIKSVQSLPNGDLVDRVAENWPLVEPVGAVSRVERFRWAPVEGASAYRLVVYGEAGAELFQRVDLAAPRAEVWPAERARLGDGTDFTWMVEAEGDEGEVLVRGIRTFQLTR